MKTINEVLKLLDSVLDQTTLETYVERSWVRPIEKKKTLYFEEMDIARIRLIHQMQHDFSVNEDAMDIVLSLLDQLYGTRERMRQLTQAIERQPRRVQAEIFSLLVENNHKS